MKAQLKESMAYQEATEACLERAKAGLEVIEARKHVFQERLDRMNAAGKVVLGRTEAGLEMVNVVTLSEVPEKEAVGTWEDQ
jgi:hypothetical protein